MFSYVRNLHRYWLSDSFIWLLLLEGTSTGNKRMHCSVYTYHGENLPYTSVDILDKGMLSWLRCAKKAKGYGLTRFMRWGYDQMEPTLNPGSRIKTENLNADVLLLAAKDDDCWPSDVAAVRIVENLASTNYPRRVECHVYEKASHALTDGLDRLDFVTKTLMRLMIPAEKKYPLECEAAHKDSFFRILKFIKEWNF